MGATDQKRIADALYMLGAGADPVTFLRTLRAYVLQHTETTQQATELLRDLAAVNPPAFAGALQELRELLDDPAAVVTSVTVHKAKTPQADKKRATRAGSKPAKRRLSAMQRQ